MENKTKKKYVIIQVLNKERFKLHIHLKFKKEEIKNKMNNEMIDLIQKKIARLQ
jgi:hypothetical protein